jgi:hypothetical protein
MLLQQHALHACLQELAGRSPDEIKREAEQRQRAAPKVRRLVACSSKFSAASYSLGASLTKLEGKFLLRLLDRRNACPMHELGLLSVCALLQVLRHAFGS